jgi:hypothetical protein
MQCDGVEQAVSAMAASTSAAASVIAEVSRGILLYPN